MNPYRTDDFKRLQAHWYRKLRESGFTDIESSDTPDGLKSHTEWNARRLGMTSDGYDLPDLRFQYYSMATEFLWRFEFSVQLHQRIWAFHAHGFSLREIGRLVGKDKDHVHGVVRSLKALMLGREVTSIKGLRHA